MSAIAGFWSFSDERARDHCARILQGQQAYGSKSAIRGEAPFASGRLLHSILPEDQFDRQPLSRGPFQFVADVRLDNREELADALGLPADRAAISADSDLLFEAFLKWGDDAAGKLVGEFAFALWNEVEHSLLLGRDLFGLRPLHFHRGRDFLAFASMPSGIHALPGVERDFDVEAITDDLAQLTLDGSKTLFRGIERVEPGQLLRISSGRTHGTKYWTPPRPAPGRRSPEDYAEGLRDVVRTAVKAQLRGTGAIASHLSAGLDSSMVTASAAHLLAPAKLLAFTATPRKGFDGPLPNDVIGDESALAAETAALYPNIEHLIVDRSDETLTEVLDRQFAYMQQPTMGPCNALWVREINRTAKARGVNVMLGGSAGNITASYSGFEAWSALLPAGRLLELWRIGKGLRAGGMPLRTLAAQLVGPLLSGSLWNFACRVYGRPTELSDIAAMRPELLEGVEARAKARGIDIAGRPSNDPQKLREWVLFDGDNGNYIKGILGEFGISMRDPLYDRRIVDYCMQVPGEEFIRGGVYRGLARRAFAQDLPPAVSGFQQRGYQGADWYETVERDLALLKGELEAIQRCAPANDILDAEWIDNLLTNPPTGAWGRRDVVMRNRYGLLRSISAGHFMRKAKGTN